MTTSETLLKRLQSVLLTKVEYLNENCTEGEIGKLTITGANGDAAWYGHTWTTIDKSYDGSYSVERDNCYLPGTSKASTATYSVAKSVRWLHTHIVSSRVLFGETFECLEEARVTFMNFV